MSTIITGGSGFIGLTIAEELARNGETVIAYDLSPPPAGLVCDERLSGEIRFVQGDARDEAYLASVVRDHNVTGAILTAAITADREREKHAARTIIDVNVGATAASLQACAAGGASRVLLLSSGAVYGSLGRTADILNEDTPSLAPENLYALTKLASEAVATRLASVLDLDLSVGRLGTCFGPLERETGLRDTLSPQWQIRKLVEAGQAVLLPRTGRRDWLYARDAAAAAVALLRSNRRKRQVYNLAAGYVWSLGEWCQALQETNPNLDWAYADGGELPNVNCYADYDRAPLSIDHLLSDTDFLPAYDMNRALKDFLIPTRL
jgi:UDP-glucuronate 4-epimerase